MAQQVQVAAPVAAPIQKRRMPVAIAIAAIFIALAAAGALAFLLLRSPLVDPTDYSKAILAYQASPGSQLQTSGMRMIPRPEPVVVIDPNASPQTTGNRNRNRNRDGRDDAPVIDTDLDSGSVFSRGSEQHR